MFSTPITWSCPVAIQAAAIGAKLPTFEMLAYSGGRLKLGNINAPVVVDLATLTATENLPALRDHEITQQVGHVDRLDNNGRELRATGVISSTSSYAAEIVADAKNGFGWQCSIGADPGQLDFIARGERVTVNGQSQEGPAYISRNTLLREISFTAVGADHSTTATIAATAQSYLENDTMSFEQWVATLELDPSNLSDKQRAALQEAFAQLQTVGDSQTTVTATRATSATEEMRIAAVRRICGNNHDLAATAIAAGWSEQQTEGHVLRASRPSAPSMGFGISTTADIEARAIQASLCIDSGVSADRLVKALGETAVEAAETKYRGCGIHGAIRATLRAAGKPCGIGRIGATEIRDAFEADRQLRASGFSSASLSNLLGNTANKLLLDQFQLVATTWRKIAKTESNSDFKEHARYRLVGKGRFEQVAPDGQLKHIALDEQEFSSTLKTYGAIVSVTRQDLINDDLSAFSQMPLLLGRLSGISLEKAVYTLLLSNPSSFFSAGNGNYDEGSDTALSITSLTAAEDLFLKMVDSNGDPALVTPKTLLVPTTLKTTARTLVNSSQILGIDSTTVPSGNPHFQNFEVAASPWLNSSSLTGSSQTAWFLFGDPMNVAAMEVAFLDGRDQPTIEQGDVDFESLGMSWRAVFDYGVAMREKQGAVKFKGSA